MNLKINDEQETYKLTVSGSLTVQYASDLLETLRNIYEKNTDLCVEIGEVENVDMTFFQLMCSAHRTFTKDDKHFTVTGAKNDLLAKGAPSGFLRHKGCSKDKFGTCTMVLES